MKMKVISRTIVMALAVFAVEAQADLHYPYPNIFTNGQVSTGGSDAPSCLPENLGTGEWEMSNWVFGVKIRDPKEETYDFTVDADFQIRICKKVVEGGQVSHRMLPATWLERPTDEIVLAVAESQERRGYRLTSVALTDDGVLSGHVQFRMDLATAFDSKERIFGLGRKSIREYLDESDRLGHELRIPKVFVVFLRRNFWGTTSQIGTQSTGWYLLNLVLHIQNGVVKVSFDPTRTGLN